MIFTTCKRMHGKVSEIIYQTHMRWGYYRFLCRLSVCLSIRLSVRPLGVHPLGFPEFLSLPLRYWLEIWYMNLSCNNTDRVRVLSCLTYFYRSYCPLLKLSFPGFSLLSLDIYLKYGTQICHDIIQIKFKFCHTIYLLLEELMPFVKI